MKCLTELYLGEVSVQYHGDLNSFWTLAESYGETLTVLPSKTEAPDGRKYCFPKLL